MAPSSLGTYRVFGTPYSVTLHQLAVALHLRRIPTKLYCRDFLSTAFFSTLYQSNGLYSCLTPSKKVLFTQNAVLDYLEANVPDSAEHPTLEIDPSTHPNTFVLANAMLVYSHCWLVKTGTGYRFVYEPASSIVLGLVAWIAGWILPANLVCNIKPMKRYFRNLMGRLLESHGMTKETMPYHEAHFKRLCEALEAHFTAYPNHRYVLLTSRPSLADVGLGTAFSSYFLMDDGPMELLTESYPLTLQYAQRCACLSESSINKNKGQIDGDARGDDPSGDPAAVDFLGDRDVIPLTLVPVIDLMQEVLPWTVAQVEAFRRHMARIDDQEKELARDGKNGVFVTLKSGPYAGSKAYPLRTQTSPFQYWMLVDQELMSCFVRAPELEVAVRAGRDAMRVWEEEEGDEARPQLRLPDGDAVRKAVDDEVNSQLERSRMTPSQKEDASSAAVESSAPRQQPTPQASSDDVTGSPQPQRSEEVAARVPLVVADDDSPLNPLATRDFSLYHQSTNGSKSRLVSWKRQSTTANIDMHDRIENILTLLARMHVPEYCVVAPHDNSRYKDVFVAMKPDVAAEAEAKWRQGLVL